MSGFNTRPVARWRYEELLFTAGSSWLTVEFGPDTIARVRGTEELMVAERDLAWSLANPGTSKKTVVGYLTYDERNKRHVLHHDGHACPFPANVGQDVANWCRFWRGVKPQGGDTLAHFALARHDGGLWLGDSQFETVIPAGIAIDLVSLLCRAVTESHVCHPVPGWEVTRRGVSCHFGGGFHFGGSEIKLENFLDDKLLLGCTLGDNHAHWLLTRSEAYRLAARIHQATEKGA